jgi:N-acetylglucosaminyl-diphospho-decaprenol L-rhamnosyltransferase
VIVIDNASCDDFSDSLAMGAASVEFIRNTNNVGFAAACNQGARLGTGSYILFLNPDVLLLPDSLLVPLRFLEAPEGKGIGICGVQLRNEQGGVARSCSRFPRLRNFLYHIFGLQYFHPEHFPGILMSEWDHLTSRVVDQVMGAFFLVRRSVFESLGGFDERFFVYFEDLDFALRAQRNGWESYYLSNAKAEHAGGGCTRDAKAARLFFALRSRILYGYKHFGWAKATTLLLCSVLCEPISRLMLAAGRGSLTDAKEVLQGYRDFWMWVPSLPGCAKQAPPKVNVANIQQ